MFLLLILSYNMNALYRRWSEIRTYNIYIGAFYIVSDFISLSSSGYPQHLVYK